MTDAPRAFQSLSSRAMQCLGRHPGLLLRLAAVPFAVALGAAILAVWAPPPWGYAFDVVNALMTLSFITAAGRVARFDAGGDSDGPVAFGFALPRPRWPGRSMALRMAGETLLIVLPMLFIALTVLGTLTQAVQNLGWDGFRVVAQVLIEFLSATAAGLVIGSGMALSTADK
ncbi:MAG: hypothetical protein HQL36_07665 [Alphaproteobacteria bacterium]|nr:hypothetical protein [Alphaproteobacteria bacterium]